MTTVPVNASKQYEIVIGTGLMDKAGEYLRRVTKGDAVMLVCGDIVAGLHAPRVRAALEQAGYRVEQFVYPHGEQSKTPETYFALLNALAESGLTRSDTIVALGGGVTGDLAGFAAATYQRGISYVQMPTTLLAAVDSSVGGKTAIDLPAGKNLAGAFYQPSLVLCDLDALATLPEDVFTDGCAEVIKYGVIWDAELFDLLGKGIKDQLEEVIARCVTIKAEIVNKDEFDNGIRGILNYGHTVGHAIEKCSHFGVSHGSAVAMGMVIVAKAAALSGICDEGVFDRVLALVKQYGLPTKTEYEPKALLQAMLSDKKRAGAKISLIIPEKIGAVRIEKMGLEDMNRFLRPVLEAQTWM
ncbi:MAG: 3-dehydroquinate synthase [Oscillospiraceae bacterium]|nr:3-dehydroquinate synthase [Oscillospiraceae bacterium]